MYDVSIFWIFVIKKVSLYSHLWAMDMGFSQYSGEIYIAASLIKKLNQDSSHGCSPNPNGLWEAMI